MNEPMGWGRALVWGTLIVVGLLGLLVMAYFAFEDIIRATSLSRTEIVMIGCCAAST